jgi:hypothetical protein
VSRIPPAVVDEVLERAADHCEACGWPMAGKMDLHHRKLQSQGGGHTVVNLLWVHHRCHVLTRYSIHENPQRSYDLGHMVREAEDPSLVAVQVRLDLRRN